MTAQTGGGKPRPRNVTEGKKGAARPAGNKGGKAAGNKGR